MHGAIIETACMLAYRKTDMVESFSISSQKGSEPQGANAKMSGAL